MAKTPFCVNNYLRDYFTYPKGQRRALAFVLVLLLPAFIFPFVYNRRTNNTKADAIVLEQVKGLEVASDENTDFEKSSNYIARKYDNDDKPRSLQELFLFDPNTATEVDWKKLGLRDKTIHTILNFRSKGGRFYEPEDLKKIYGLREAEVNRLLPYVAIKHSQADKYPANKNKENAAATNNNNRKQLNPVDINSADTTGWIALPGIGSKLASRIVKYRDALGRFYSITQVAEVYGLADSTYQKILPLLALKNTTLVKRNINTATIAELKTPYIPNNVANAIVQYRNQHGNFATVSGIKNIPLIDEALYLKIAPYLTTGL